MKARQLIARATYDPNQLKTIGKAFDDAWQQIAPTVSNRADAIEAARLKLASIVLSLARANSKDAQRLTKDAVQAMLTGAPQRKS